MLDTISSQFSVILKRCRHVRSGASICGWARWSSVCCTVCCLPSARRHLTLLAVAAVPFFPSLSGMCATAINCCARPQFRHAFCRHSGYHASILPHRSNSHSLLRNTPECTADANRYTVSDECILPCSEEPLLYTSWHPVMAWWAAEVGMQALVKDVASLFPLISLTIPSWNSAYHSRR